MKHWFLFAILALIVIAVPVNAAGISGQYVEARTCDVWSAPCFANAEMNLAGKHGLMAWKVDRGTLDNVSLEGLSVVAVISASDTLGMKQTVQGKALLIVDSKADAAQRGALIRLAKEQGGDLVKNVVSVQSAPIDMATCQCQGGSCAKLTAGKVARIETRCINTHTDNKCGNEFAFYPPLTKTAKATPAVAIEHCFTGQGFNETWKEAERRGAYVGTFESR
jgi:hypothetical protein